ncbi:MAG: flagellar biosynthesis protein FlhB [Desulfobacteraceae bacterium]|nr:flagellar biosynthesis protein FlhB [Desulfobacteraceae bacterium]
MAETDQEKTEPATPKKRSEARKKGQVAQSREIPSVAVLLCSMTILLFAGGWMINQIQDIMRFIFQRLDNPIPVTGQMHHLFILLFQKIIVLLAPLFLAVATAGVISNIAQIGFMISGEAMTPKFSKFNPINGIKRLVSVTMLVELIKSCFKIFIIGCIAYYVLIAEVDKIPAMVDLSAWQLLLYMQRISIKLGYYTCLILIVLAISDYVFQRWKYEKDLRMTKQEVKDEHKQREGDPKVKQRIRSIQIERAMKRMMESVPRATVVITNPTHLAIAIEFERSMYAPRVLAKGSGKVAERIREIAQANDVPLVEEKMLARALYKQAEIGDFIPVELYHAVAEILAYVYRLKGMAHTTV